MTESINSMWASIWVKLWYGIWTYVSALCNAMQRNRIEWNLRMYQHLGKKEQKETLKLKGSVNNWLSEIFWFDALYGFVSARNWFQSTKLNIFRILYSFHSNCKSCELFTLQSVKFSDFMLFFPLPNALFCHRSSFLL